MRQTCSQLLMPPWATGRRQGEKPNNPETIDYLMEVTERMGQAIRNTHDKIYKVGQSRDVVGYAAGGTTEGINSNLSLLNQS